MVSADIFQSSSNKHHPNHIKELILKLPESELLCANSRWVFEKAQEVWTAELEEDTEINFNQFQTIHKSIVQDFYHSKLEQKWLFIFQK
jgi:hypothetical protein